MGVSGGLEQQATTGKEGGGGRKPGLAARPREPPPPFGASASAFPRARLPSLPLPLEASAERFRAGGTKPSLPVRLLSPPSLPLLLSSLPCSSLAVTQRARDERR